MSFKNCCIPFFLILLSSCSLSLTKPEETLGSSRSIAGTQALEGFPILFKEFKICSSEASCRNYNKPYCLMETGNRDTWQMVSVDLLGKAKWRSTFSGELKEMETLNPQAIAEIFQKREKLIAEIKAKIKIPEADQHTKMELRNLFQQEFESQISQWIEQLGEKAGPHLVK